MNTRLKIISLALALSARCAFAEEDCEGEESMMEDVMEVGCGVVVGCVIGGALGVAGTLSYQRHQGGRAADTHRLVEMGSAQPDA